MFLKIAPQAFEAGDFLNIFCMFWVFEAHFLITFFLVKKIVWDENKNGTGSMTTAKNEVSIGLYYEIFYSVGEFTFGGWRGMKI